MFSLHENTLHADAARRLSRLSPPLFQEISMPSTQDPTGSADDVFELYDLRVEVVAPDGAKLYCGAKVGDYFELKGEMLHLPPGQGFSIYSLAALLPLLASKQRRLHPNDWMSTDAEVACPDPNCPSRFRIVRSGLRRFNHADTTAVKLSSTEQQQ
jgi:uncharacterized repeat protein (TIGR04076 family)